MKAAGILMDATEVKSGFGKLADRIEKVDIGVQKRGKVQAYIISPKRYEQLLQTAVVDQDELSRLDAQFQQLIASMQTPQHRHAVDRFMSAPQADVDAVLARHYEAHPVPAMAHKAVNKVAVSRTKPGVKLVVKTAARTAARARKIAK